MTTAYDERRRLIRAVVAVLAISSALISVGASPQPASAAGAGGCWLSLSPTSGPVGTLVSITGSNATCNNQGYGGPLGFADEHAGVVVGQLPAKGGPFFFRFRIPTSMPRGDWWAAAQAYAGGGPVAPGPSHFVAPMVAPFTATFNVTSAPPGWADYASIASAPAHCRTCLGADAYDLFRAGGFVFPSNYAPNAPGSAGGLNLVAPIVAAAFTPDGGGYWMLGADGGVFTYGDAHFYGSAASNHLPYPFVGIAPTPDGGGYWLVTSAGGIYPYGDAAFRGQARGIPGHSTVVGIAPTVDGQGYWIVAEDGGVFSFGDAVFHGSMGGRHLNAPIVGMTATPDGGGYWLVGADGGVFSFGNAAFHGSAVGVSSWPMVGIAATADGRGYWLLGRDGGVFTYGDAHFAGSGRS